MTDPIAAMLTRMRNALDRQQPTVAMPHSKVKVAIADVLKNEGYIESYEILPGTIAAAGTPTAGAPVASATGQSKFPTLVIRLRYVGGRRERLSLIHI